MNEKTQGALPVPVSRKHACPLFHRAAKQYAGMMVHPTSGLYLTLWRIYDALTGLWRSRDPLENAERSQGPNLYEYVADNPISHVDPLGLKVYLCCASIEQKNFWTNLGTAIGCKHCWIKTDTTEAGMGPSPPGPLPPGIPYGIPTEINNEAGHAAANPTACTEIKDVDEACVNRELQIGKKTGTWGAVNNCNTLAQDILGRCKKCNQHGPTRHVNGL